MSNAISRTVFRTALPLVCVASLLVACDPAPTRDDASPPAATPDSQPRAPADTPAASPPSDSAPDGVPPPSDAPTAPAQPPPEAPPPSEPSPSPKPTSTEPEPPLGSMRLAQAPSKLSVPVDLKYSFDSEPQPGRAVTLHLAAVPRVAGTNLVVNVKAAEGVRVASGTGVSIQKARANDAYRQRYSITREASVPELRVLVTMDMPEGSGFGFFSIPFEPGKKSQKLDSVKQR